MSSQNICFNCGKGECLCPPFDTLQTLNRMGRASQLVINAMNAVAEDSFNVGDKVYKVGGDYTFEGIIVAGFYKLSGAPRYVVEDDRGVLHVYSFKNLKLKGV